MGGGLSGGGGEGSICNAPNSKDYFVNGVTRVFLPLQAACEGNMQTCRAPTPPGASRPEDARGEDFTE